MYYIYSFIFVLIFTCWDMLRLYCSINPKLLHWSHRCPLMLTYVSFFLVELAEESLPQWWPPGLIGIFWLNEPLGRDAQPVLQLWRWHRENEVLWTGKPCLREDRDGGMGGDLWWRGKVLLISWLWFCSPSCLGRGPGLVCFSQWGATVNTVGFCFLFTKLFLVNVRGAMAQVVHCTVCTSFFGPWFSFSFVKCFVHKENSDLSPEIIPL